MFRKQYDSNQLKQMRSESKVIRVRNNVIRFKYDSNQLKTFAPNQNMIRIT